MNGTCTCGCCEGIERLTPLPIANRPGLKSLAYRVGTHATFLETMQARLTDLQLDDPNVKNALNPLLALKTRAGEDPSIALLDVCATVGEVLAFYQERMANEGYLLTATERRSILELAQLVGYKLRPGVAASVYLAFTMEKGFAGVIPIGVRAQSIPGPGELPQSFETAEPLKGRAVWNELRPRMGRPQYITAQTREIYFNGVATNLKTNDILLINFGASQVTRRVVSVTLDNAANRTKATLDVPADDPDSNSGGPTSFTKFFDRLRTPPPPVSIPPASSRNLFRSLPGGFREKSDLSVQALTELRKELRAPSYDSWRTAQVTEASSVKVYAMRLMAGLFGHNVPKKVTFKESGEICDPLEWKEWELDGENGETVFLDNYYDGIKNGDYLVIRKPTEKVPSGTKPPENPVVFVVVSTENRTRAAYGISAKTTAITLNLGTGQKWLDTSNEKFDVIRGSAVYSQSELLELDEEPIMNSIGYKLSKSNPTSEEVSAAEENARRIELDDVYDGLESGRWLMISGERDDIEAVTAVRGRELVMLSGVTQGVQQIEINGKDLPGDKTHTTLELANRLAFSYKRGTVTINANVVRATHGETRLEILGSGDGSKVFQKFSLRQSPLTYVSASTSAGIENTLRVRVNDVLWHETDSLVASGSNDRDYFVQTDNEGKTTIIFGDGVRGGRLPTGIENVRAVYRSGIGRAGNVAAEQISLLSIRPLGVKGVFNPQAASGGADPEDRDHARQNAPLHLKALDRAVSVQDYADFARAFAGIGKALATRLSDGRRELVYLTIAGADDIPITKDSDLYRNLRQALFQFGDPHQPLEVELRELKLIVMSANVRLLPDYLWEATEPRIRAALLDAFSFERRTLGQDVLLSEALSAMQAVTGVDYVDIDDFDALDTQALVTYLRMQERIQELEAKPSRSPAEEGELESLRLQQDQFIARKERVSIELARADYAVVDPLKRIKPAEIAYLSPNVPDTLVLKPIAG